VRPKYDAIHETATTQRPAISPEPDRATAIGSLHIKLLVKYGNVVFEIRERAERYAQTHIWASTLITVAYYAPHAIGRTAK